MTLHYNRNSELMKWPNKIIWKFTGPYEVGISTPTTLINLVLTPLFKCLYNTVGTFLFTHSFDGFTTCPLVLKGGT